jgi:hypothetical protein
MVPSTSRKDSGPPAGPLPPALPPSLPLLPGAGVSRKNATYGEEHHGKRRTFGSMVQAQLGASCPRLTSRSVRAANARQAQSR